MFYKTRWTACVTSVFWCLAILGATAGCDFPNSEKQTPKRNDAPREYTKAQRIAEATRILSELNPLPSPLLDAHVDEKPTYDDMGWGPTDSTLYMYLKVSPKDMGKWDAILGEKGGWGAETPGDEPYTWWFEPARFPTFDYYDPWILLRLQGWVFVSRETGEIWIEASKT